MFVDGELKVDDETAPVDALSVIDTETAVQFRAKTSSKFIVVGGKPLGHRFMWWNFISSRQDRIEDARKKWEAGEFDKVVGDEKEYIPLPDAGRSRS